MNLANYKITTKVLSVILVLGAVSAAISVTAIFSLKSLNDATDEMETAAGEALLGARMMQDVLALNRAEFRMVSDPTSDNLKEAKETVGRRQTGVQDKLAEVRKTAGPRQTELLAVVESAYGAYSASLNQTMAMADSASATVQIGAEQQALLRQATNSLNLGRQLEEAVRTYSDYTDGKVSSFSEQATATYTTSAWLLGRPGWLRPGL